MKVVLGTDYLGHSKAAATMIAALRPEPCEIELVHVLERLGDGLLTGQPLVAPDLIARYLKLQDEEAHQVLLRDKAELERLGLSSRTTLLTGLAGNRLIAHAAESGADLLALGSSGKGPIEEIVVGSISRKALTSAPCSVLIAKREVPHDQPLTAVIATDHSAYANRCIEKFVAWRPRGIGRIVVVTVYPKQLVRAMTAVMEKFKADVDEWLQGELERHNMQVVETLKPLGTSCKARVESGDVGDTLERVMREEQGDLLVLGAQGRGFLERLTIGSVSMDQGLRRPYSCLVMRS